MNATVVAAVALFAGAMIVAAGCRAGPIECDCAGGVVGLVVYAPEGAVTAFRASGPACNDARLRCVPADFSSTFVPGCSEYQLVPARGGKCHVDIQLKDGTAHPIDRTFVDHSSDGCCGGIFAEGGGGEVWLSESSGDAGAEASVDGNADIDADASADADLVAACAADRLPAAGARCDAAAVGVDGYCRLVACGFYCAAECHCREGRWKCGGVCRDASGCGTPPLCREQPCGGDASVDTIVDGG